MMESRDNFHHDDLLARAVDAVLHDPIPGEPPPERIDALVAAVRQAADQPRTATLIERIKNMRPATKLAVTAAAVLVIVGLISWLVPGRGAALAFADVGEALNNVRRHAEASRVVTTVELSDSAVKMTIQDDGQGFKPPTLTDHPAIASGLGLVGMHERARLLNGSLVIDSAPGRGTKVIVNVPV